MLSRFFIYNTFQGVQTTNVFSVSSREAYIFRHYFLKLLNQSFKKLTHYIICVCVCVFNQLIFIKCLLA